MSGRAPSLFARVWERLSRSVLVKAAGWSLGGSAAGQAIRFLTNLVLTRLLAPSVFGTMAIVTSIAVGAELVSDLGIRRAIITSQRVDDEVFLRSAWTLKLVRGLLLGTILCALAYPAALWFGVPSLKGLIAVTGLNACFQGASHVCEFTLMRAFKQRTVTSLTLLTAVTASLITVVLAWWLRSPWALALGGTSASLVHLLATHYVGRELPMKWTWDAPSLREIRAFGRWIFVSSTLAYGGGQADRLVFGSVVTLADLGRYSLASNIAQLIPTFLRPLGDHVLLPLYAQAGSTTTPEFRLQFLRIRRTLWHLSFPPLCVLIAFGDLLVGLVWDARYQDAGWMVQCLSVGFLIAALGNLGPVHLARGDAWFSIVEEGARAAVRLGGIALGHWLFGLPGVMAAIALSSAIEYPLSVWLSIRYGLWAPKWEALALASAATTIGVLYALRMIFCR